MTWVDLIDALIGVTPRRVLQLVLVAALVVVGPTGVAHAITWYAEQRAQQTTELVTHLLIPTPPALVANP